jgi:hypothetical protein
MAETTTKGEIDPRGVLTGVETGNTSKIVRIWRPKIT